MNLQPTWRAPGTWLNLLKGDKMLRWLADKISDDTWPKGVMRRRKARRDASRETSPPNDAESNTYVPGPRRPSAARAVTYPTFDTCSAATQAAIAPWVEASRSAPLLGSIARCIDPNARHTDVAALPPPYATSLTGVEARVRTDARGQFSGFLLTQSDAHGNNVLLGGYRFLQTSEFTLVSNDTEPYVRGALPLVYHYRAKHMSGDTFRVSARNIFNKKVETKLVGYGMRLEDGDWVGDTAVVLPLMEGDLRRYGWVLGV